MTEKPNNEPHDDLTQELFPELSPKTLRTFKSTVAEMWPIFPAELLLSGVMLGIYAIAGRFSVRILYSAALGTGLVLLNFAAMIFSLIRAERYDSPAKGQLAARGGLLLRMLVLVGVLVLALKYGNFDPLSTLLPLCFMRIALFAGTLAKKKKPVSKGDAS